METVKTPNYRCPCGYVMNRATSAYGEHTPTEDDITFCMSCGKMYQFNKDLSLRPAPDDLLNQLSDEERRDVRAVQDVIQAKRTSLPKYH